MLLYGLMNGSHDTLHAEEFPLTICVVGVCRLCQAVGVEEKCCLRSDSDFLLTELRSCHHTDREMGIHRQKGGIGTDDERSIMTCIAIGKPPRTEVEHTDEERDEHIGFVSLAHRVVHLCDYFSRT